MLFQPGSPPEPCSHAPCECPSQSCQVNTPFPPQKITVMEYYLSSGQDSRDPYWCAVWPSAVAMSDHLTGMDLRQLSVLEMGCGLGLAGISAALHGGCAWLWGGPLFLAPCRPPLWVLVCCPAPSAGQPVRLGLQHDLGAWCSLDPHPPSPPPAHRPSTPRHRRGLGQAVRPGASGAAVRPPQCPAQWRACGAAGSRPPIHRADARLLVGLPRGRSPEASRGGVYPGVCRAV